MESLYKVDKLGNYIEQIRGISYKPQDISEEIKEGYKVVLRANSIQDNKLLLNDLLYVKEELIKENQFIKSNDILMAASSGSKQIVGKSVQIKENTQYTFGAFCKLIRCKENINPNYVAYFFRTPYYRSTISAVVNGANINNLKNEHIDNLKIPLPEKKIQKQIVEILDKSQELIDKRKEQIEKLDELVKSRFIEMFGDPIKNNRNWDLKKVGEVAFVTKLAGFEYTQYINYQDEGDVIVIKGLNVKEKKLKLENISYIDKETSDLLPRSQLKKDDLVMTYVGINIGDVAIVDGNNRYHLAPNVAKISLLDDSNINPVYMVNLLYMSRILFSSRATNTSKQALNMKRIRDIDIMIPPLELQNKFAVFYEQVDKLKFEMENSLKELEENFNSLMQKAFKGELFN